MKVLFELLSFAVMMTESGGNHLAVSSAGAKGLYQLMPIGVEEVRQQFPCMRYVEWEPFDPEINRLFGELLLRFYLSKAKGDVREALTLYNGGYAALRARRGGNPFPETKQYVIKVCRIYRNCDNKLLLSPLEDWGHKGKLTTIERIPSWSINQ